MIHHNNLGYQLKNLGHQFGLELHHINATNTGQENDITYAIFCKDCNHRYGSVKQNQVMTFFFVLSKYCLKLQAVIWYGVVHISSNEEFFIAHPYGKILFAIMVIEPTTLGLLLLCSTNCAIHECVL